MKMNKIKIKMKSKMYKVKFLNLVKDYQLLEAKAMIFH